MLVIAFMTLGVSAYKVACAGDDVCKQTPEPRVTATPTSEPSPTPPQCGEDEHLNNDKNKCLKFELGGAPTPADWNVVRAAEGQTFGPAK